MSTYNLKNHYILANVKKTLLKIGPIKDIRIVYHAFSKMV